MNEGDSVRVEILDRDQKELRGEFNHFVSLMNTHMLNVMSQLAAIREKLSVENPQCKTHAERLDKLEKESREMWVTQNRWIGGVAVFIVVLQVALSLFGPTIRTKLGVKDAEHIQQQR